MSERKDKLEVGQEVEVGFDWIGTISAISDDGTQIWVDNDICRFRVDHMEVSVIERCSLCGGVIRGIHNSHNAQPVTNGICCSSCNMKVVIPARMESLGF